MLIDMLQLLFHNPEILSTRAAMSNNRCQYWSIIVVEEFFSFGGKMYLVEKNAEGESVNGTPAGGSPAYADNHFVVLAIPKFLRMYTERETCGQSYYTIHPMEKRHGPTHISLNAIQ